MSEDILYDATVYRLTKATLERLSRGGPTTLRGALWELTKAVEDIVDIEISLRGHERDTLVFLWLVWAGEMLMKYGPGAIRVTFHTRQVTRSLNWAEQYLATHGPQRKTQKHGSALQEGSSDE